jgi:hypothetical protein
MFTRFGDKIPRSLAKTQQKELLKSITNNNFYFIFAGTTALLQSHNTAVHIVSCSLVSANLPYCGTRSYHPDCASTLFYRHSTHVLINVSCFSDTLMVWQPAGQLTAWPLTFAIAPRANRAFSSIALRVIGFASRRSRIT